MRIVPVLSLVVLCLIAPLAQAQDRPPIRDVPELYDPLFYIAIADEIRRKCSSITERRIRGISELMRLRSRANQLGYSDAEIRAFYESEDERNRMRRRGEQYLSQFGANPDNPDSLCAFGRSEIDRNSAIGVYLREN